MRATCAGARSGRSAIMTGPLVVSRMSLSSPSACSAICRPCLLEVSAVDESYGERAPGERTAERIGEPPRRAAAQCRRHRAPVGHPLVVGRARRLVGDARLAEQLAVALEAEHRRDLHAGARLLEIGRNPP